MRIDNLRTLPYGLRVISLIDLYEPFEHATRMGRLKEPVEEQPRSIIYY
jgi:hypothetical protein